MNLSRLPYRPPCMYSNLVFFLKDPCANPSAYVQLSWCPDRVLGRNKETWLWHIRYQHSRTSLCMLQTVPWSLDCSYLHTAIFLYEIGQCRMVSLVVGEETPCHMPAISVLIFIRQGAYFQWLVVTMSFSKGFAGSEEWPLSCLWGHQAFLCILPFFLLHFLLAQLGQYETLWRCSFWRRQSQQVFFDKPTVCATQRLCLPRGVIPITRACASYVILMYLHTYIPVLQWEDATRNFSGVWAELPPLLWSRWGP